MENQTVKRKISEERPWMKYYDTDFQSMQAPKCTVYSYMKQVNRKRLDATAVNYYGAKISYRQLIANIDEAANAFAAMGVKAGDTVSFLSVAVPECIAAVYALNKIGATANTIDPRLDVKNISRMIQESGSRILLTIDVAWPKVAKIRKEIRQKKIITLSAARSLPPVKKIAMTIKSRTKIPYGETIWNWDTFLSKGKGTTAKEAPYVGDHTVAIAYTGGTTGFPKGVMLTNDSMNSVAFNFKYCGLAAKPADRFLGIIPIFTSYGVVCGMHMPLCMGFELIPVPKFVPENIGKLVKTFRPNHMIATPAFYGIMIETKEVEKMDLSFLITMGSGGDTMNEGLEAKLTQFMKSHKIKYPLAQGYGMSEVSAAASFCVNDIFKSSSVGIPSLTTTIGIFHPDTGEELDYYQEGEICITGPTLMKGYYQRPEETEHVMRLHEDGRIWVHSGDVGYMDEDGFLFVKGRVKRMITRFDGHKVFPVVIESMVSEFDFVHNCSVIGVADREHNQGDYPMVLVEFNDGVTKSSACKILFDECNSRLEERGKPVAVVAVDEIPLTGSMKNDYRTLENRFKNFDYLTWQKQNGYLPQDKAVPQSHGHSKGKDHAKSK